MANDKPVFHGIDGKQYDNIWDKVAGDSYARMEQKKAEDIREQNRLLEENIAMQEELYNLELEKEQNRKEESFRQIEHEKEMRILKLFDDAGISKSVYDNYMVNNFSDYIAKKAKIYARLTDLLSIANGDVDNIDQIKDDGIKEEMIAIFNDNSTDNDSSSELTSSGSNVTWYWIGYIIVFIGFFLILFNLNTDDNFPIIITIIVFGLLEFFILYKIVRFYRQKKQIEEPVVDTEKVLNEIKKLMKKEAEKDNKLKEEYSEKLKEAVEDFYKFRVNHYNPTIEKLLRDVDYPKTIGLIDVEGVEFKTVNNSNKKKNGSIEDYVEYFENHS